ncbi:putative tail component of prophage, partial [Escherichia coli FDA504]
WRQSSGIFPDIRRKADR